MSSDLGSVFALLFAAVALSAASGADACPRLLVESDWGPDDRLMPERETYEAHVTYALPWTDPVGDCAPAPSCFDPLSRIRFESPEHPGYASVRFDPADASLEPNVNAQRYEATTRVFIATNASGPSFEDGTYVLQGWGCGNPTARATIIIKNDYQARTSATAGEPYVLDGPAPGIPSAGAVSSAFALATVATVGRLRRKKS